MMTLDPKQEMEKENREMEKVQRSLLFVSSKSKVLTEEEDMEGDSGGSSEEMESPRSVGRWKRRSVLHSQVLRIREEDSHLGETTTLIGAAANKDHQKVAHAVASGMDVVLFARPILPCSPLKNTVNALH